MSRAGKTTSLAKRRICLILPKSNLSLQGLLESLDTILVLCHYRVRTRTLWGVETLVSS